MIKSLPPSCRKLYRRSELIARLRTCFPSIPFNSRQQRRGADDRVLWERSSSPKPISPPCGNSAPAKRTHAKVIVVGPANSPSLILQAIHCGAIDFLDIRATSKPSFGISSAVSRYLTADRRSTDV